MVTQVPNGTVVFEFHRPGATQVHLAGDFTGWHEQSLPMQKGPDGYWRCQLRLAPGTYQFKYCSDGQWYPDYAAFGLERGPWGWNSVLKVEPAAARSNAGEACPIRRALRQDRHAAAPHRRDRDYKRPDYSADEHSRHGAWRTGTAAGRQPPISPGRSAPPAQHVSR